MTDGRQRSEIEIFLDAWNADDWGTLEGLCDPEIVIQAPEQWPESGEYHGWRAVRAQWLRLKEPFSDEGVELLDFAAIGVDTTLVHVRWRGHGSSGLEIDFEMWTVSRFKGDLISRIEYYRDEQSARAAL
jgi:ketosteroid isomerase-like protein